MNRIILVGNGFDLAHNLRTSYKDFMDWYWSQWVYKLRTCHDRHISDGLCSFILRNENSSWSSYFFHNIRYIISEVSDKNIIEDIRKHSICSVKFKPLMERIVKSLNINNWVDIENEYYQCLLNPKSTPIAELNKELDTIRALLIEYLTTISSPIINPQLKKFIQDPIIKEDIAVTSLAVWKDFVNERLKFDLNHWKPILYKYEMEPIYDEYDIRFASYAGIEAKDEYSFEDLDKMQILKTSKFALLPDNIMLLNFNYTNLADQSLPNDESFSIIHIHGELTNPSSVIFGYGDEMDEGYETLKRKNDNEYLKHMKTARYLETNNYRRMLTFVESAPYQVYIMGHSCGNSDRTLLNTLFEHPNCISIKPFYYEDKKSGKDNYLDIVQNISRNFTDAKKMRDRVVNKMYCQPLPQLSDAFDIKK